MFIVILIQFYAYICIISSKKYVMTKNGPVSGIKYKLHNSIVNEYLGIPFAQPPINELRFKSPKPLNEPAWKEIFHAHKPAKACIQAKDKKGFEGVYYNIPEEEQSEDCLQLNMWVPDRPNGAVLVFIFGGGLRFGSASLDIYNGSIIAAKTRTIVVNLNYRLGIFGFSYMCCGNDVQGNMGLLDQQMGMRWVYRNIKKFGGNPSKITLWGSGAGSASVTAHLLAHDSYKYFRRIIATSGVITNIWARQYSNRVDETLRFISLKYKCFGKHHFIYECIKKLNTSELANLNDEFSHILNIPYAYGFNIVDNDDVFFKKNIYDKLKSRDIKHDVDILIGRANNEGSYFLPTLLSHEKFGCNTKDSILMKYNDQTCKMNKENLFDLMKSLSYTLRINSTGLEYIKKYYFKNKIRNNRFQACEMLSNIAFDCDIIKFARKCAFNTDGYLFSYIFNVDKSAYKWPKWMGTVHGAELEYAFGLPFRKPELYNKKSLIKQLQFSKKFMKMIGDFAKSGNPRFGWPKFDPYNIKSAKLDFSIISRRNVKRVHHTIMKKCKVIEDYTSKYVYY
uniref:Acetylcholinesterase n=1 Tax=Strongyloides stercoralis TaxID=6248 RepID=A0A0K0DV70_STRER